MLTKRQHRIISSIVFNESCIFVSSSGGVGSIPVEGSYFLALLAHHPAVYAANNLVENISITAGDLQ